ncbi:hypothetical protein [Nonomuraea sp. GTA35]|uniref:hypothetical protein n=1 Tax=Nonomuraea sp. GTA35 TaxID=1676746 RepID=UPI0035C0E093
METLECLSTATVTCVNTAREGSSKQRCPTVGNPWDVTGQVQVDESGDRLAQDDEVKQVLAALVGPLGHALAGASGDLDLETVRVAAGAAHAVSLSESIARRRNELDYPATTALINSTGLRPSRDGSNRSPLFPPHSRAHATIRGRIERGEAGRN